MASIGVITTILTFVGIGVYVVDKFTHRDVDPVRKELVRRLGVVRPGDIVILEVQSVISDEAHSKYMDALSALNTGVKFVLLSGGVRVARVGQDES